MITLDELTNAIGKPMADPAAQAFITKLGPGTRSKDDLGIYQRHKTGGVIMVEKEGRLATIFLQPKGKGFTEYAGEIPFGMRLGLSRDEVRAALGEPTWAIATIADEYDQGLWTFRLNYKDLIVSSVTLKAV